MLQRGVIKLPTIISIALGLGLGASMFLNYHQHQRAEQERKLLKGEITDLRYQVQQDKLAMNFTPTPSPGPAETPTPSATPSPSPVLGAETKNATVQSSVGYVNMRQEANTRAGIVAKLNNGTVVTLGSFSSKDWQEISANGKHGYVAKTYLKY
jgi:uncharacterized protein YgiM (DUF1202 family)